MGSFRYSLDGFKEAFLTFKDLFKIFKVKHNKTSSKQIDMHKSSLLNKIGNKSKVDNITDIERKTSDNVDISYEQFKKDCDMCKKTTGSKGCNMINSVDFKNDKCDVTFNKNRQTVNIVDLVNDVSVYHKGWVTNPSKLTKWKGWKK